MSAAMRVILRRLAASGVLIAAALALHAAGV